MWWHRRRVPDRLDGASDDELRRAYRAIELTDGAAADAAARAQRADRIAVELLRRDPDDAALWFDRALLAEWRRDWPAAAGYGTRALDLVPVAERLGDPAAWNLGIAATARRDWVAARAAWTAFGVPVAGAGDDPVVEDLGTTPVRLNPPPRFVGQREVTVDGRGWDTEVVWGVRLDPARVQLISVPLPESGHRHGDVVLHDGDPNGTRSDGEQEVPVFDEIELWERSPRPTLSVVLPHVADDDVDDLLARLDAGGMTGEDWTANVRMLCRACSEGAPGAHHHPPGRTGGGRTLGVSGDPAEVEQVLAAWRRGGAHRDSTAVTVELE